MKSKLSRKKLKFLLEQYGERCFWCKCELPLFELHVEHVIPRARGGRSNIENLRLSCPTCNSLKYTHTIEDWQFLLKKKANKAYSDLNRYIRILQTIDEEIL